MIHFDKKKCTGCTACQAICPKQCIEMIMDEEGFFYPQINVNNCVNCGLCEKVCPTHIEAELTIGENDFKECAYGLVNLNSDERDSSSSGGAFSLIAKWIIEHDGVVFGAFFDDKMKVCHGYAETSEMIKKFRGSKYLQSNLRDTFHLIKDFLDLDRWVLFSGTGCQIEGLLSYLGREYDKLLCQDVACYGTTSPRLLELYIQWQEEKHHAKVKEINFRDKSSGWKTYSVSVLFDNQKRYLCRATDDLYMRAFLSKLYLRPSCYSCHAKGVERKSDITLADFWGVEKIMPQNDDDKGCSLVIIHSEKGMKVFEEIKKNAHAFEVGTNTVVENNPALVKSVEYPEKRSSFIEDILNFKFSKVVRKYCSEPLMLRIKIKLHRILFKRISK